MRVLADLSDGELLTAAGTDSTLENGAPSFASSAWFIWLDLHFPAKPDNYFVDRPRREPGEAGPKEWAAFEEYMDYVAARGLTRETDADRLRRAGGMDFSGWQPHRGPTGEYRCPECDCSVEAGVERCGGCVAHASGWSS